MPTLTGDLKTYSSWLPTKRFSEQLDLLLQLIERKTPSLGQPVRIDLDDTVPLVWVRSKEEVVALIAHLREMGRLDQKYGGVESKDIARLSAAGLLRLEEIDQSPALNRRIFVAMWFDDTLKDAYDKGIDPAIRNAGFEPIRVDRQLERGDRIDTRILVEIRRCRAVVADATGRRASVMYEAGFAEGLGKKVIWTVREDHMNDVPFDTRQLPHIRWNSPAQLAEQLQPIIENRLAPNRHS